MIYFKQIYKTAIKIAMLNWMPALHFMYKTILQNISYSATHVPVLSCSFSAPSDATTRRKGSTGSTNGQEKQTDKGKETCEFWVYSGNITMSEFTILVSVLLWNFNHMRFRNCKWYISISKAGSIFITWFDFWNLKQNKWGVCWRLTVGRIFSFSLTMDLSLIFIGPLWIIAKYCICYLFLKAPAPAEVSATTKGSLMRMATTKGSLMRTRSLSATGVRTAASVMSGARGKKEKIMKYKKEIFPGTFK